MRVLAPGVLVVDDLLPELQWAQVRAFLFNSGWDFGWKSKSSTDTYAFWHRHFAGHRKGSAEKEYDCSAELRKNSLGLFQFWGYLGKTLLKGHTLYRCYANAQTYGSDGTIHTDSKDPDAYTAIYYPCETWEPNWAGETVIFNADHSDIVASIYPRPNRLAVFKGNAPHVARGVARTCPVLRAVLVFKTKGAKADDRGAASAIPAEQRGEPGEAQRA